MINCIYTYYEGKITIEGHANYAPTGSDIVCAGVSSIEFALKQYLDNLAVKGVKVTAEIGDKNTFVCLDETYRPALDMAWAGLTFIADNYPEYVSCWWG